MLSLGAVSVIRECDLGFLLFPERSAPRPGPWRETADILDEVFTKASGGHARHPA